MVFHMDEVPLLELKFYARNVSLIYLVVLVFGIVMLCLTPPHFNAFLLALTIVDVSLVGMNIFVLRLVVWNASRCNCLSALLLTLGALIVYVVLAIIGVVRQFIKPYILVIPILWILLEISTVVILHGFYKKIVNEGEAEPSTLGSTLLDREIEYSHSAV